MAMRMPRLGDDGAIVNDIYSYCIVNVNKMSSLLEEEEKAGRSNRCALRIYELFEE